MKVHSVDLYEHFGFPKPEGARGTLTCILQDNFPEICATRRHPAILVIPGGAYRMVSSREAEPVALRFLCRGWQAFILDYSVVPCRFPTALREAAMAMRYIRENAESFLVDPAMVAAMGFSAGGHLCGSIGMMYDSPEVADIGSASLLRPDGLCLCYPVLVSWGNTNEESFVNLCGEDQQLRQRMSLDRHVRPDMPPVYLWHTRNDTCVPCRNSTIFANRMEEEGVEFAFHMYRHGPHGLSNADSQVYPVTWELDISADVPGWMDETLRFFEEIGLTIKD